MSRYVRDEIISQGLELASSPTLSNHDMPLGVIDPNAYSIKWLQNALDMFYRKYPFASTVQKVNMTIQAGVEDLVVTSDTTRYLPTDFIIDCRDGLLASFGDGGNLQQYRLQKQSFQYWLDQTLNVQRISTNRAGFYTIINRRIKITPNVIENTAAGLWYYALPVAVGPLDQPDFPDEWTLIEFLRLKALEWSRAVEPGIAQVYMTKELSRFQSAGLLQDSEYESVPIRNNQVFNDQTYIQRNSWMGPPVGS